MSDRADDSNARGGTDVESELVKHRYDRVAPIYDAMEWVLEWLSFGGWRRQLWSRVVGPEVLEVGVGTGKNLSMYPDNLEITAIDISPKMLERARRRAEQLDVDVKLMEADAQRLPFDDDQFDTGMTTFVFCSVPDAVRGLRELRRVVRPGGQLIMLEHVLSEQPILRPLMRWLDWLPSHIWGAHIDRQTVENVRESGFEEVRETNLALDVVKRIEGRVPE